MSTPAPTAARIGFHDLEQLVEEAYWSSHIAALMVERSLSGEPGPADTRICRMGVEDADATTWIVYEARNRAKALRDRYFAAVDNVAGFT